MNPRLLIRIARILFRVLLAVLGIGVMMTGWGLCPDPESAEVGVLLILAGVLLPGAEWFFHLLKIAEKKIP